MTDQLNKSLDDSKCQKCQLLESQLSDIRTQIEAFSILAEKNRNLSGTILLENLRTILDEDQKNDNVKCRCKSLLAKSNFMAKDDHQHKKTFDKLSQRDIESNWDQVVGSFSAMCLDPALLQGIYAYGFESPSAIQQRLIVPCMRGWDVIAKAKEGTGRTTGIIIGMLQRIEVRNPHCQAIILTLTTESARKIQGMVLSLGIYMGITCHVSSIYRDEDIDKVKGEGVQIVVGPPIDVHSLIIRQIINSDDIQMLVVDDADKLLTGNFRNQTLNVMTTLPMETQVILMSSVALPSDVTDESKTFMRNPVSILVKDDAKHERNYKGVREFYLDVDTEEWKLPTLCSLYEKLAIEQAIVFCNTVSKVDLLTRRMKEKDYTISAFHGDLEDEDRDVIMKEFGSGTLPMLITTDALAPNIDHKPQVPVVINYDFPKTPKNYMQRIWFGRRFGGGGKAISFVTTADKRVFQEVQIVLGTKIEPLPENFQDQDEI